MFRLEFNDADVRAGLESLSEVMTDMTPVMQEIGDFLIVTTKDRFPTGKGPDGTPWAAKSATTVAAYERRGQRVDNRPLYGPNQKLHKQIFYQAGPEGVEWGSNRIYAAVMQFGAAQGEFGARMGRTRPSAKRPKSQDYFMHLPWGNIPARPFLGVSESDREGILDIISEALTRAAGGD